jgi:Carboxypeptidase regulatory-like domain
LARLELKSATGQTIRQATSDANGNFAFKRVAPGVYAVVSRKKGYKEASAVAISAASGAKPVRLTMESQHPLELPAIVSQLNRARNALSPETGSTVYRFSDKNIDQLPQGDNTALNDIWVFSKSCG